MKKFTLLLVGVATLAGVVVFEATTSRQVTAQGAARDQGLPGGQASVSGRRNRWPNSLELRPV